MPLRSSLLPLVLLATLSPLGLLEAQQGAPARGDWPSYGGDLGSTKYSPLDEIDRTNFEKLQVVWRWDSTDQFLSMETPGGGHWWAKSADIFAELNEADPDRWRDGAAPSLGNLKATPLMIDSVLYLNTPISTGVAVDARTGKTLWVYNPRSYEAGTTSMTYRWNQRGVAHWGEGETARVFWGTGDGYLICVLAISGRPCADFGENGHLDLMTGLPGAQRGRKDWQNQLEYSVQSPPLVVRNTVLVPQSISSNNLTREMPTGWMRGFDVITGETRWTFHTIPQPGEPGHETWENDAWSYTGKVGVWTMMSADEELGIVYLPINTPAPDYYGGHRPGANLFAESLVALDVETGQRVWHFQLVHHGLWDYDPPAAPNLLDVVVDGRPVKAVVQVTKQGFAYAFDRVTGEPLWPIVERPVPTSSNLVGEVPYPTQPFPSRPAPFEYQGTSIDDLVDFTPEIRALAVAAVEGFRLGPLFTPPSLEGTLTRPGSVGGANWGGAAADPETGILYIPSRNASSVTFFREPRPEEGATLRYVQGAGSAPRIEGGLPLWKPPYSRMTAIDMNTGEHVWMTPTGEGKRIRSNPLLQGLDPPQLGGDAGNPGPLLTKTLLIYPLLAGGTNDGPRLVAYDKATGEELGSLDLPGTPLGTPMTYLLDGRQFIALTIQGEEVPAMIALRVD